MSQKQPSVADVQRTGRHSSVMPQKRSSTVDTQRTKPEPDHAPRTKYVDQLLEAAELGVLEGWGIAFSTWLLLAGFIVFPGTFTNIEDIDLDNENVSGAERWLFDRIKNLPLLVVAGICSGIGAFGMILFWIRWKRNYILITENVFLPGILQGLTGVIATVVNVYTAQYKQWSIMAKVSVAVEGGCSVICGFFFAFYWGLMFPMKRKHDKEMENHHRRLIFADDEEAPVESNGGAISPVYIKPPVSRIIAGNSMKKATGQSVVQEQAVEAGMVADQPKDRSTLDEDEEQEGITLVPENPKRPNLLAGMSSTETKVM